DGGGGSSGRRLHAQGAQAARPLRPGRQGGEPGHGRARGSLEGRARGGGRWLRLRDRREDPPGQGRGDRSPEVGAAPRPLRGGGGEVEQASAGGEDMDPASPHQAGAEEAARGRVPADSALIRRGLGAASVFAATAVALAFLLLPIAAIFARVSPGELVAQLSRPVVTDALVVSLKTSAIAQALVLLLGTPTAYLLATRRFRGHSFMVVLVE